MKYCAYRICAHLKEFERERAVLGTTRKCTWFRIRQYASTEREFLFEYSETRAKYLR